MQLICAFHSTLFQPIKTKTKFKTKGEIHMSKKLNASKRNQYLTKRFRNCQSSQSTFRSQTIQTPATFLFVAKSDIQMRWNEQNHVGERVETG